MHVNTFISVPAVKIIKSTIHIITIYIATNLNHKLQAMVVSCLDYVILDYYSPVQQPPLSRLTVVSREAKKKQHAHVSSGLRNHYNELFTQMAALKF